jgi:hypothetical protein
MNYPFIILLSLSILSIFITLSVMKSKEGYQPQRNAYSFMYTEDNNGMSYRYNGEVPRFSESDYFG